MLNKNFALLFELKASVKTHDVLSFKKKKKCFLALSTNRPKND